MSERNYRGLFWCLAVVGLLLDQGSKYGIFAWLAEMPGHTWVMCKGPDRLEDGSSKVQNRFQLVAAREDGERPHVNQGALFGWKGFLQPHQSNALFALISLLAAAGIVYWTTLAATVRDGWLCAALGLILGGTLGNLYDRVVFSGVRDFLHWSIGFDWPVFNIADCCLVTGAGLLLLQAFLGQPLGTASDSPAHAHQQPVTVASEVSSVR